MTQRPTLLITFLFLAAPLLFASNMVVARGIADMMPPAFLAFGRWGIAALLLLPFVWPALKGGALRGCNLAVLALLVVLGGMLSVAPLYAAAGHTTAGNIALIVAITPLIVALIERVVWKVPMSPRLTLGVAVAVFGIGLATSGGDIGKLATLHLNPGDALALIAALAWAGYTVVLRHYPVKLAPLTQLWVTATGAALGLLPFVAAEWAVGKTPTLTLESVGGVAFLAIVAGVGAYSLYGRVIGYIGAARASMSMYLVPVYALLLGAVLLGEPLGLHHLAALVLVSAGVGLGTARKPSPTIATGSPLVGRAAKAG